MTDPFSPMTMKSGHTMKNRFMLAPLTNLQQCWMEQIMVEAAAETGRTEIRWQSRVTGVTPAGDHVVVEVETPAGGGHVQRDEGNAERQHPESEHRQKAEYAANHEQKAGQGPDAGR